jgi:hypothetical protein
MQIVFSVRRCSPQVVGMEGITNFVLANWFPFLAVVMAIYHVGGYRQKLKRLEGFDPEVLEQRLKTENLRHAEFRTKTDQTLGEIQSDMGEVKEDVAFIRGKLDDGNAVRVRNRHGT